MCKIYRIILFSLLLLLATPLYAQDTLFKFISVNQIERLHIQEIKYLEFFSRIDTTSKGSCHCLSDSAYPNCSENDHLVKCFYKTTFDRKGRILEESFYNPYYNANSFDNPEEAYSYQYNNDSSQIIGTVGDGVTESPSQEHYGSTIVYQNSKMKLQVYYSTRWNERLHKTEITYLDSTYCYYRKDGKLEKIGDVYMVYKDNNPLCYVTKEELNINKDSTNLKQEKVDDYFIKHISNAMRNKILDNYYPSIRGSNLLINGKSIYKSSPDLKKYKIVYLIIETWKNHFSFYKLIN